MTHGAELVFEYQTASDAERVATAIQPEVGDIDGDRTSVTVEQDGKVVTLQVEAADLVALRAGCNTWMSLLDVAERTSGLAAAGGPDPR